MGESRPAPILSASTSLTERSSEMSVANAQIKAPATISTATMAPVAPILPPAPSAPVAPMSPPATATPSRPWFESWFDTPYYHQLYGRHDEQEAAGFVEALVSHLLPADGSRMLDVGCGAGRHSRALAA